MKNKYGPWATLIDIGGNPQLSAFWKRRLKMLVPASRTSPVLSRRNLSLLTAAGILACILPTVFFTPVAAQEKKPSQENDTFPKTGVYITTNSGAESGDHIYIPVYISFNLSSEANRKRLNITNEQETKLREISDDYEKLIKSIRNEMKKSAPKEQAAKQREYQAKLEDARKAIRKQIEEFLSPEQLAAMRKEALGLQAGVIIAYTRLQERIGLTDEQKKQWSAMLNSTEQKAISDRFERLVEENSKKMLAVITPQQWDELDRIAGQSSKGYYAFAVSGMSAWSFPGTEIEELQYPETIRKLKISAQQQAKLKDIIAQSERQSEELGHLGTQSQSPAPTARQRAQQAEMSQKEQEFRKHNHQQIVETLTPQQMSELRKICVQEAFLLSIANSRIIGRGIDGKDQEGILNRIKAGQEQIAQLQSLEDEINSLQRRNFSTLGEQVLGILTTKQQEDVFDVLDDPNKFEDSGKTKSSADDGGGNGAAKSEGGTITIGGGTLVAGPSGNNEKPSNTAPADEKPEAPAKAEGRMIIGSFSGSTTVSGGTLVVGDSGNAEKSENVKPEKEESQSQTSSGGDAATGWYGSIILSSTKDGGTATIRSQLPASDPRAADDRDSPEFDPAFCFSFYSPLAHDKYRKELGLTSEQENKLREISQNRHAEEVRRWKDPAYLAKQEALDKLPDQEHMAKLRQTLEEEVKPVRKQVDQVLTAEQLTALKNITLRRMASLGWGLTEPLTKILGISDAEQEAFYKNVSKLNAESYEKSKDLENEISDKMLAVLTPAQRTELERQAGKRDCVLSAFFERIGALYTPSTDMAELELDDLSEPDVRKALALSRDQWDKINAILKSQPVQELYKLLGLRVKEENGRIVTTGPEEDERKIQKTPDRERKTNELKGKLRDQIEKVFTPQQAATLKTIALRKVVLRLLKDPRTLKELNATDQQISELKRLREQRAWVYYEQMYKAGEAIVDKLSPQRRERLVRELDREEWRDR
jgi:hypothetical protein